MNENSKENPRTADNKPEPKPTELGGVLYSSHVKIFDPNTKEVLVNKRGDN